MQKNVLLIESDTPFARAMSKALESRGFGVRTSPDGKEGFELARALHPDCVVLCVELPGLSGYSWCNRLKKDGDLKSIPLVITSSEATPETFDQHRKLKTRAEDYLLKPFSPETLVERVTTLVGVPDAGPAEEELVTLDDVELDGAPAEGARVPAEEDADLKMLDDAFDNISRGGDEPGSRAPGAPAVDLPLTLMPDADESPALSEFDREMAAALSSLAEEAAEASSVDPFAPSRRRVEPRVESVAQEETPILLEDVEVLPAIDEEAAAALQAAREEAATLRAELASVREEAVRLRLDGERLGQDGALHRDEAVRLRGESAEAQRVLAIRDAELANLQARLQAASEQSAQSEKRSSELDGELSGLRSKLSDAERSAVERGAELVEAERRTEELEREIEVARTESEGLRAEIESLRSSADGVRGEAAGLRNEVATLGATADGLRAEGESLRAEISSLRTEVASLRADADARGAEVASLRGEAEARGREVEALRGEAQAQRDAAEAFRSEAESRATAQSRRIEELEEQATDLEDRVLRAYQKIKSDEKLREKTRKALAMVLQILEDRPAGDGGGVER
jgi:CheY-like chemotaxis protein